jgi:diaminohydroxyphosphoribosylaminopyrimidine deaminase / 5-amino-6-(5-phosphoribosylamino)uracil reductase
MEDFNSEDKKFMNMALELAKKGRYSVAPNPMVGAVIVKDGRVISKGYHKKAGMPHAEIEAISKLKEDTRGKKMYVTLEPCNIWAKTPPCTDALINSGFTEIIMASYDPNPRINGGGSKVLRDSGIKVRTGLLKEKAEKLNEIFFKHMGYGMPFVCAKVASSIDGKIAADDSSSKWITSAESRRMVQDLRRQYKCVATGINTIICDDATLLPNTKKTSEDLYDHYYRVVFDSRLRISADSNLVKTSMLSKVIVFTNSQETSKIEFLRGKGIDVIVTDSSSCLKDALRVLYEKYEVVSVLIEAGKTLLSSFLREGLIDKFVFFIAPKIIGKSRYGFFDSLENRNISDAYEIDFDSFKKIGPDITINAYPKDR